MKLVRIGQVSGVPVHVHWSVFVVTGVMLLSAVEQAAMTLVAICAYLGVLLLHEWGHLLAARRVGCTVWSIELYPLHGLTRYSAASTRYDTCVVAWGGVLAQLAVALPLVAWTTFVGFTSVAIVNGLLALFGYFSAVIAAFNLLPFSRLDGAIAWQILPILWRRFGLRRTRPPSPLAGRGRSKGGRWVH